jgi:hypothetical protein
VAIPRGSRVRVVIYSASKGGCFRAVSMFSGFLFWEVAESPQPPLANCRLVTDEAPNLVHPVRKP